MTKFFLIRHATTDTAGKRLSGRQPGVHLNAEGQAQAESLAQRLSGVGISAIYSSPLERAIETAGPIATLLNLDYARCENFLEIDFGQWTDCAVTDLEKDPEFKLFNSFRSCTRIPGGELMGEAQERVISGLENLCAQHPEETIAIISHSDLIKSAIAYYSGIHLDMLHRLEISPASVSVIEIYSDTARILLLNHTGEIKFTQRK